MVLNILSVNTNTTSHISPGMKFFRESTLVAHQGLVSCNMVQLVKVMFCQTKGNWQGSLSSVVQSTQGTGAAVGA